MVKTENDVDESACKGGKMGDRMRALGLEPGGVEIDSAGYSYHPGAGVGLTLKIKKYLTIKTSLRERKSSRLNNVADCQESYYIVLKRNSKNIGRVYYLLRVLITYINYTLPQYIYSPQI